MADLRFIRAANEAIRPWFARDQGVLVTGLRGKAAGRLGSMLHELAHLATFGKTPGDPGDVWCVGDEEPYVDSVVTNCFDDLQWSDDCDVKEIEGIAVQFLAFELLDVKYSRLAFYRFLAGGGLSVDSWTVKEVRASCEQYLKTRKARREAARVVRWIKEEVKRHADVQR